MTAFQTRAIQLASEVESQRAFVDAFRTAVDIALCTSSSDPTQTRCLDDENRKSLARIQQMALCNIAYLFLSSILHCQIRIFLYLSPSVTGLNAKGSEFTED